MLPEQQHLAPTYYGKIPIRNLWLLVLYASAFYHTIASNKGKFGGEDSPEDIPDLVGEFLASAVEKRLASSLTCRFTPAVEELSTVRGKIDLLHTERHKLLDKGKVACRVENFTPNTPRNRLVRAALEQIAKRAQPILASRCAKLATMFRRCGVIGAKPSRAELSSERFGQQDRHDVIMVKAALLYFELMLPLTTVGMYVFASTKADAIYLRKLYEKAVAGFYSVVAAQAGWVVTAGAWQDWQKSGYSQNVLGILPKMQLDILLEHPERSRRIIIDTKFTTLTVKGLFRDETLRSHYIYQMYAYLRSQEKLDDKAASTAEGILLHPSIFREDVNEHVGIQGHVIRFATVDLAGEAKAMRQRLLSFLD